MSRFLLHMEVASAVFALATSVPVSAGQAGQSPDLLTGREVKQLVASARTPADHMRLSRHYSALAAKYAAKAAEHEAMGARYRRTPTPSETKRPGAPDTALHCERLAEHARNAAEQARAQAAYHAQMAGSRQEKS